MKKLIITMVACMCLTSCHKVGKANHAPHELSATSTVVTSPYTTCTAPTTVVSTTSSVVTIPTTTQPVEEPTESVTVPMRIWEVSELEYVHLCNVVANEYGADSVPMYEKALVVEVVMNRVASEYFPNTIDEVLEQENQFSGYVRNDFYQSNVTDGVKDAVDLFLNQPHLFNDPYLYMWGDGERQYFE